MERILDHSAALLAFGGLQENGDGIVYQWLGGVGVGVIGLISLVAVTESTSQLMIVKW